MGVNLNAVNTQNFFKTGVVSGQELQQVSSQILSQTQSVESTNLPKINFSKARQIDTGLKLVGGNSQVNSEVSRQIAGIDITLSTKASTAINNLNTQAAINSAKNVSKNVSGNLHINDTSNIAMRDLKSVFATSNNVNFEKTTNLDKDKKGQGGLFNFGQNQKQQGQEDTIDLVI